ncbi:isocitrate/isopropylmalate dehydrogenase family protein [Entomobacter blattae]|uniref:Isocitrate dehydrogenase n=1 Tax=Entomobacter blattae TaxID=2762277 RepID=A0A7H1NSA1_9PROT|nr:isocitrate/isopropylmalate family dehydrogenase [Entomobacter blattae]QNT78661.1 Isocitrate dehydrogenase [Entomobacter blattae]
MSLEQIPATLIPGDGIGPEIMDSVTAVLTAAQAPFVWESHKAGLAGIEEYDTPLPQNTLESIRKTGLALKGPLTTPVGGGFKSINVTLRQEFGLYANVRPVKTLIPEGRFSDIDLVVVRENLEGFYAAQEHYLPADGYKEGIATCTGYTTRLESQRIVKFAFDYAMANGRKKVTIVHKANILKKLSGLFLEEARKVAKTYAGKVDFDERIVDACAMQLVINPWNYDVIVTTNLFGDILSDLASGLVGGLGLAPGSNIGTDAAIFEAVHGSAPDIAGKNTANPLALLMAATLMLRHVKHENTAKRIEIAIERVIKDRKALTPDIGGTASTRDMEQALIHFLD